VAFDGPGAPRIPEGVRDRLEVVGHTRSQTCERLQVTGSRVKQPLLEGRHVQVMQRGTEALDEVVAATQHGVGCQDTLEIGTLLVFQ